MITASFWLSVLLKCSMLLAASALLTMVLRHRSAALLHRIWAVTFAACLLLPGLTLLMPHLWSIPGLQWSMLQSSRPDSQVADVTLAEDLLRDTAAAAPTAQTELVERDARRVSASAVTPTTDRPLQSITAPTPSATPSPATGTWHTTVAWLWITGVALTSLLNLRQHLALRRLLSRSGPAHPAWDETRNCVCHSLGLTRHPRLLAIPSLPTPAVTGLWKPTILVPEESSSWSHAQRELVLLHELAHVQRHDLPTQLLPRLCCILLWFHPLAWYGAWQMRRLRELACDDLVLRVQQTPADYADLLLHTAKAWQRCPGAEYATGMIHGPEIRQRILAILDQTRSRIPVTRRTMTLLLSSAAAIVVGFSTLQFHTGSTAAGEPNAATVDNEGTEDGNTQSTIAQDETLRPMQITVLQEDNTPLANARVHASAWNVRGFTGNRYGSRKFRTNDHGQVVILVPRRLRILRLWATQDNYVPEFVNFAEGTHREGRDIPEQFTFRLASGTQLSGRIVNEQGIPIEGVNVAVSVEVREPVWTRSPKPMICPRLTDSDWFDSQPVTDKEGRWSLTNAPAATNGTDYRFSLKLSHPSYVSDNHSGALQSRQAITTAMLRDGSARIVMPRGVAVTGRVTDSDGKPVTSGLVVWNGYPYGTSTVYESEIDATGRYTTLPLSPGNYPFTVIAPGHSPELQQVTVQPGMDELNFQLSPGQRLQIAVVDENNQPIPNASIAVRGWRKQHSLHNYKHPSVPETGIPRYADGNGVWTWDWAPQDQITLLISAEGFNTQNCHLQAKSERHIIHLTRRLQIAGTAIDANTRSPLDVFQVIPVRQIDDGRLITLSGNVITAEQGRFTLRPGDRLWDGSRFRVRIEAEGYRSWISNESITAGDSEPIHAQLTPSPARKGRVTLPNGSPVAGANIIFSTESSEADFYRNHPVGNPPGTRSDRDGRFKLADSFENTRIRILHDQGFAETVVGPGEPIPLLVLQPWASVTGLVMRNGQPVMGESVFLDFVSGPYGISPYISEGLQTLTDENGRYEFPRVPRVPLRLATGTDASRQLSRSIPLNLSRGPDHREVNPGQGRPGVTVTAHVTNPPDTETDGIYSRLLLLPQQVSSEFRDNHESHDRAAEPPIDHNWANNFDQIEIRRAPRESFYGSMPPNGRLQFHSVPAGTWDLLILYGKSDSGRPVRTVRRTFEIGDKEIQNGQVELGELKTTTH